MGTFFSGENDRGGVLEFEARRPLGSNVKRGEIHLESVSRLRFPMMASNRAMRATQIVGTAVKGAILDVHAEGTLLLGAIDPV